MRHAWSATGLEMFTGIAAAMLVVIVVGLIIGWVVEYRRIRRSEERR